jgi:hypothetical protein
VEEKIISNEVKDVRFDITEKELRIIAEMIQKDAQSEQMQGKSKSFPFSRVGIGQH